MDCSLLGSSVHGIFQARVLEWIAISFSRRSSRPSIERESSASEADSLPFVLSLGLAYFSEVEVESVEVDCLGLKILILLPTF